MVSKHPYPLLKFRLVLYDCTIGYICDKFGDFQRSFRGTSKCFYYKIFCIELRCEWVNTKDLEFFIGMLLHSSVAMETSFGHIFIKRCEDKHYSLKFFFYHFSLSSY